MKLQCTYKGTYDFTQDIKERDLRNKEKRGEFLSISCQRSVNGNILYLHPAVNAYFDNNDIFNVKDFLSDRSVAINIYMTRFLNNKSKRNLSVLLDALYSVSQAFSIVFIFAMTGIQDVHRAYNSDLFELEKYLVTHYYAKERNNSLYDTIIFKKRFCKKKLAFCNNTQKAMIERIEETSYCFFYNYRSVRYTEKELFQFELALNIIVNDLKMFNSFYEKLMGSFFKECRKII